MHIRYPALALMALICLCASRVTARKKPATLQRPKLVVGLVIDQMRWDYLYRYYDRYGSDGFRRLLDGGYACQQAFIPYVPTFTAPGHASIYTGTVPAIHGIAGNDWLDPQTCSGTYCTDDASVLPVGGSYKAGRMSPRLMLSSTIGDELRLATNKRARVFGISLKDRAAILPAGHMANGAFWYDDSTGHFMTSSYYGNKLPAWLQAFNARRMPDSLMRLGWELLQPMSAYRHSTPDSTAYEGRFKGSSAPVFPHRPSGYGPLRYMPAGNELSLAAAKACIAGEGLGKGPDTDMLAVNLASTDYAGHQFGPNALEMEDMFVRLDLQLAEFLKFLDRELGKGQYVLFLTADHGGAHNYRFLQDQHLPAGDLKAAGSQRQLNAFLNDIHGADSLVGAMTNYQVFLNEAALGRSGLSRTAVRRDIIRWLERQPGVSHIVDMEDLGNATVPEPVRTMVLQGYHPGRSGSLQIIPEPGWYAAYSPTGTTHGSWNPYDSRIPLIWYGWKIPKGEGWQNVSMTDIAPTLAALLRIQMPNGCTGRVIEAVVTPR